MVGISHGVYQGQVGRTVPQDAEGLGKSGGAPAQSRYLRSSPPTYARLAPVADGSPALGPALGETLRETLGIRVSPLVV